MGTKPDPGQLERLRRELDELVDRRNIGTWSEDDQITYDRLCANEYELLDAQAGGDATRPPP